MPSQRQSKIGMQAALMEFIEYDQTRSEQRRVLLQQPRQYPFGHHRNSRLGRHPAFAPHPVTDRLANGFAKLGRHIYGSGPCR
ncbi:hypothetical protein HMSSN139_34190 [Paenibacillus sp. HMSSN-139]|nr:hypothetical protein HMSSN139_34190 [Paenibacillus sp. HMSSN-139]